MKFYSISKIARLFGLSRSTLLYYDRMGLLSPSRRTSAGYRVYADEDVKRLDRICLFRQTSLSIEDIRIILQSEEKPCAEILEKRLQEIGEEILDLKAKQGLISTMLKRVASDNRPEVDKKTWVEMLRAAGMDDQAMGRWHSEFEHRAPEAHHNFLLSLGISEDEIQRIRRQSREMMPDY